MTPKRNFKATPPFVVSLYSIKLFTIQYQLICPHNSTYDSLQEFITTEEHYGAIFK